MFASLSDMLVWKPRGSVSKQTASHRAPTTTSDDSSDDASECESATSNQSGALKLRRLQSCPSSVSRKTRLETQPESESESDNESTPRPALKSVYSFARAGLSSSSKLFFVKPRPTPTTPIDAMPQTPHSLSNDTVANQSQNLKIAGARVATPFGLGKIMAIRDDDGIAAIELQASELLFLNPTKLADIQVVPALVGECVQTPSGIGRVVKYNVREQQYTLRLAAGGSLGEYVV
ncbi:uncharacterized protein PHALS_10814 [Plasmopara halstedii]|uniref:Uncharacterized protein n=1 Tax=Plasmopara halstedii TaxID=4781 RepID=A0A0P1AJC1_PLAHL|nr:uncharacterized protein PHALS_10814 [Plasmopara halstedii]CEG40628.1 hypothetical protein PHALS_10814 [Plasmopara halstedii]|eukprot:XP_024576997.1 hypothetical protein PHALS_10814 [Plasmopara halstedii]